MSYDLVTKDGITIRNIPDDVPSDSRDLKIRVEQLRATRGPMWSLVPKEVPPDKTPPPVGAEGFGPALEDVIKENPIGAKFAAFGAPVRNLYERAKQVAGKTDVPAIQAQRKFAENAPIANIAGNVATYAPLAMIPGAQTIAGGAAIGAATGAAQPTLDGESTLMNTIIGAGGGAAVPAVMRGGKFLKAALVDPFTQAGHDRITGGLLQRAASDPQSAFSQLSAAKGSTPGFIPTVGQSANDAGLASLERATRSINPQAFGQSDTAQRGALASALRNISQDDLALAAAKDVRETAAQSLYGKAFQSDQMRRELAQQAQAARAPFSGVGVSAKEELSTPALRDLASRPAFKEAINEAKTSMRNRGIDGNPLESLEGLHRVKLAIDDALSSASDKTSLAKYSKADLVNLKNKLVEQIEILSPTYKAARQTFADLSAPINQMQVGKELENKLIPAIYRDMDAPQQLNAAAYAKALKEQGPALVKSITGQGNKNVQDVMTPDQMKVLAGIADDLQKMKILENAGRGAGSDTIQKASMSHLAASAGVPNWITSVARVPGGMIKQAGAAIYGKADEAVQQRLIEALQDPKLAAEVMKKSGVSPSRLAEMLKTGTQGIGLSVYPSLPRTP